MSFSFYSVFDNTLKKFSAQKKAIDSISNLFNSHGISYEAKESYAPFQKRFVVKDHKNEQNQIKNFLSGLLKLRADSVVKEVEIAEVDESMHVKVDEENLIIFNKIRLEDFYKEYLGVTDLPRYTASVNVAEFHTYIVVEDTERDAWKAIGGTVYPIGKEFGNFYVRNDTTYHQKYSRNIQEHKQGYNSFFDKGYHYVKRYISQEQLAELKSHAAKEFCAARDLKSQKYSVIGMDGKNCADFSTFASKYIFEDHNWFRFLDVEKIDYRDKGVLYNFWSTFGAVNLFISNFPKVLDAIFNQAWKTSLDDFAYKISFLNGYYGGTLANFFAVHIFENLEYENIEKYKPFLLEKNFFGNTPLHDALKFGRLKNAKFLYVSEEQLGVKNNRGETPLMLLAKFPASPMKHELMEKWSKLVNVNDCDLYCEYTALTNAVLSEDDRSVEILLDQGANINFVNNVLDGIGNIALSNAKFGALDTLIKRNGTEFLYHDNLTRQLPICLIRDSESRDPDLMYLKGLLHNELIGDLPCKTHDEYHNIFEDHQQIEFLI